MKKFKLCDYKNPVDFSDYEALTAKEAICAKCYECCCYDGAEVKKCNLKNCSLWSLKEKWFKIPRKMTVSEERKEKMREHMKNVRNKTLAQHMECNAISLDNY